MLDIYKTFLSNTRQILDISHIHLSFKGVLQYIAYNVHYAWQQHNLVIFTVYISCIYMCILSYNMYIYLVINTQVFNFLDIFGVLHSNSIYNLCTTFLAKEEYLNLPACDYDTIWSKFGGKEFQGYDDEQ